jgi:hypothetical protein
MHIFEMAALRKLVLYLEAVIVVLIDGVLEMVKLTDRVFEIVKLTEDVFDLDTVMDGVFDADFEIDDVTDTAKGIVCSRKQEQRKDVMTLCGSKSMVNNVRKMR